MYSFSLSSNWVYAWLLSNSNVIRWFLSYQYGVFILGFNYVKTHSYPALGYCHKLVPGILPLFRITTPDTHCFDDLTSTFNFNLRLPISCVGNLYIRLASWISCTNPLNAYITNGHTNLHANVFQGRTDSRFLRQGVRLRFTIVQSPKMCEQQKHG